MAEASQSSQEGLSQADPKRRRLEPEKARASYLSGQLRLRLQYAKLKVEHGWQRQSLSEVENLYFRHTQKSRPPLIPSGRRNQRVTFHTISSASPNGSSSIFPIAVHNFDTAPEAGASSLGVADGLSRSGQAGPSTISSDSHAVQGTSLTSSAPSQPNYMSGGMSTPLSSGPTDQSKPLASEEEASVAATSFVPPRPQLHTSALHPQITPYSHADVLPPPGDITNMQFPGSAGSFSSFSITPAPPQSQSHGYDPLSPSREIRQPASVKPQAKPPPQPAPAGNQISAALDSMSASGLTYDSFWSTHTPYRPPGFGMSAGSVSSGGAGIASGMQPR